VTVTGCATLSLRGSDVTAVADRAVGRFGRSSTVELPVGLTPEDRLVSRRAGFVDCRATRVRLANTSSSAKPLRVVPPTGAPFVLPAGALWPLPPGATAIEVAGRIRTWIVDITVAGSGPLRATSDLDTAPATDLVADPTDLEREALAAVCAPLLQIPSSDQPNSYEDAAALLPRASAKAIARRLDKLTERLLEAGTPGLAEGRWRLGSLARVAVDHGVVVPADLDLLDARRPGSGR
jgi:hypothetical protein